MLNSYEWHVQSKTTEGLVLATATDDVNEPCRHAPQKNQSQKCTSTAAHLPSAETAGPYLSKHSWHRIAWTNVSTYESYKACVTFARGSENIVHWTSFCRSYHSARSVVSLHPTTQNRFHTNESDALPIKIAACFTNTIRCFSQRSCHACVRVPHRLAALIHYGNNFNSDTYLIQLPSPILAAILILTSAYH